MTVRITIARIAAALLAIAVAGLLFAWSGVLNLGASTGHWQITDWFLHWTMRNSVRTHAALTAPADPADATGLVSAAGHFAQSCAVCHGAPGERPSPVMQSATPAAPDLAINAREWNDKQLFWILQHGVKYTGMPAWASQNRPDEVKRMVAFVRRLPGMTPAQYRALTGAVEDRGVPERCIGCHGADGAGRGQRDVPVLGGQHPGALYAALHGYAGGRRESAVMQTAAARLDDAEMRAVARYFAAMPGLATRAPVTGAGSGEAERVIASGLPDRQLPACASCHGADKPQPVLAGQRASYIAARLRGWRGPKDVIDARQPQDVMPVIARRIPEELIDPIAKALERAGR